ncbi:MAG: DNA polymerase III subunit delta [Alphaproteobacteria bacterium]|nr:DNA polymerase III subunit delta [Alphaproteobacteria bacterium]
MKLDARQFEGLLRDPGSVSVVLLAGEDTGMIRERARRLVIAVAGSSDDPFRVAELERENASAIPHEMASLSLTGGRRVVRVREATDTILPFVMAVLEGSPPGFLVLEAPGAASKSKLRAALEKAPKGVAMVCYPLEGRALEAEIRAILGEAKVSADGEALRFLAEHLGADHSMTRGEIEKLALFVGPGGEVDLPAAQQCVGDMAGLSLDDALFSATAGDIAGADRALELAMAEGAVPVTVLRTALTHMQKLQRARAAMAEGLSAAEAAKALRPPLFFRREPVFVQALNLWSSAAIELACTRLWEAERACKRTGTPSESLCRSVVIGLAQRSAANRRR